MDLRIVYLLNITKSFIIIMSVLQRSSSVYSFFLFFFFSQYLQDESKTKRSIDLNLLEWTHYSMKPHVSDNHLYFKHLIAFPVMSTSFRLDFLPFLTQSHLGVHSPEEQILKNDLLLNLLTKIFVSWLLSS